MYKIAILGCENSHAKNFLTLISEGRYPEIEVIGVFSEDAEAAEKLNNDFGVAIMESYDSAVGKVDGIMITARHGDNHYKYAKPYLSSGIPMFIDKPITCSEAEAVEFMKEARANNVRLCGGSTCAHLKETKELAAAVANGEIPEIRGGSVSAPLFIDSEYGGFFFYASHLVEIMTAIFGDGVREIYSDKRDASFDFLAKYDEFNVLGNYIERGHNYSASVYGRKVTRSEKLNFTPDSFTHEMDDMYDLLRGKEMKKSYESFILPVFIMNTILRSAESGKWENIPEIIL